MIELIKENWELVVQITLIVYAIAKIIVNLTPSENDNLILAKVVEFVEKIIDLFIPNLKKGGGTHNKNIFKK